MKRVFYKKRSFYKKLLYVLLAFVALGMLNTLSPKYSQVNSEGRFNKIIANPRYNLSVVMFYSSDKMLRRCEPDEYRSITRLIQMFKNTSLIFRYRDADLAFIGVNLCNKKNAGLAEAYGIGNEPTFMLFKDGQPYTKKGGPVIAIRGFVKRPRLQQFIDAYFSSFITENRKRNEEIRQKRIEENLARSYYWGPYWGYYGGCGGCFGRPYWGFGGGCGGCFGCW